jgi:hypothetical protein
MRRVRVFPLYPFRSLPSIDEEGEASSEVSLSTATLQMWLSDEDFSDPAL